MNTQRPGAHRWDRHAEERLVNPHLRKGEFDETEAIVR